MSGVKARRTSRDEDWELSIPREHWDGFLQYARESRLPMRDRGWDGEVRKADLAGGFRRVDVAEVVGFYFDGVFEVEIEGD